MYARPDLPKLYHLDADEGNAKPEVKTRKLSPVSAAKLISTNETKPNETKPTTDCKPSDEAGSTDHNSSLDSKAIVCESESSESKPTESESSEFKSSDSTSSESKLTESKPTESKSNETNSNETNSNETKLAEFKDDEIDLHADERMSDPEPDEKSDIKLERDHDSKEDSRDDSFEKDSNCDREPEAASSTGKRPVQLNISSLREVINELKSNKSRVTKISVEKCFQRRNTSLPKNEITEYINKCINQEILEKVKYRDYYGIRMKASFKNGKRSPSDEQEIAGEPADEADKLSINDKCSVNDKSSSIADLDNLSECSFTVNENSVTESNVNTPNEELDEEPGDGSGYNTKKSSLKRCTPTIRYLLRTAPEEGISASDILKSLQNKRILILYDLKKFVWLMKTYFVDKNIAEQLRNGNYRVSNDEENSNASQPSAVKCQSETELLKANKEEEIDLLADEKFSDNENFESSTASVSDGKQQDAQADQQRALVKQVNRTSNYLTVESVNRIIDEIDQTHKSFSLANILQQSGAVGLGETELASFLVKCIENGLLKKKDPIYGKMIMYTIKKSQVLDRLRIDEITYQKVISALKVLLKDAALSPELMLIGLKDKFKLLYAHNLVSFNDLIRNRLLKEGFLQELPNNNFKLLLEINDETSNTSVQSASNLEAEYMDFEMLSSSDNLGLKRKSGKALDNSARRPISQRKKIKKSLGPDFLDPSGVKYQLLKSSYEDKCEICLKNSDKTMVDCRKCKFKAHRLCLSEIDLMFRKSTKKFECESCRVKCRVCEQESEALMSSLMTCKRCNISYHSKCLPNMTTKVLKGCPTCEKTYLKYLMNKDDDKLANSGSSKDSSDKNTSNNLEIDEASSSDINVRPNLLEEVPTLTQLKEIEMTDNDLNQAQAEERAADVSKAAVDGSSSLPPNDEDALNDGSNEDSNQSNAGSSASSSSNAENASAMKRTEPEGETLLQKYRKLFKAYDVHQQVKITKEQFNTLKSLNSYSNGKNPGDWSVDDVADFITSIGFPDESLIFRKEEIDGKSLLLLRRNDVLTGLSMRLGPALKVYSYIYKLQASTN